MGISLGKIWGFHWEKWGFHWEKWGLNSRFQKNGGQLGKATPPPFASLSFCNAFPLFVSTHILGP
jgi:hypothetical protein